MFYLQPAHIWTEALPVGNGRLGAMVFGGANQGANNGDGQVDKENADLVDGHLTRGQDEHLQLNEGTLWRGDRKDLLNPKGHEAFESARKLLLESKGVDGKKIQEAEDIAKAGMISTPAGMPSYSTVGDLYLRSASDAAVQNYRRELDLATGIVRTEYVQDGVHYTRETFASFPAQVIVVRWTADKPHSISFTASMDRPSDFAVAAVGNDHLTMREGPEHTDLIRFLADMQVLAPAETLHADGHSLVVKNADAVTLIVAVGTDFRGGPFPGGKPDKRVALQQRSAAAQSYSALLDAAAKDHRHLFDSLQLRLGSEDESKDQMPTDVRLAKVAAGGEDLGLQELYFDFARYLLIGSSRDAMPANLQGLWASAIVNKWGSKYTVNINTEMNYWLAEPGGLGELTLPLFTLIDLARNPATGTAVSVANKYYDAHGFVIHHNTDIWGHSHPIDQIGAGIWPMGAAWLVLHAWDHYAYSGDVQFLRERAWPMLEGASQFFLDYLTEDADGHLVTGPSLSPENRYKLPDGSVHSLTMAPTMDNEILRELFSRTLDAGNILKTDPSFLSRIEAARAKLPPLKIGKLGNIQEWQVDYAENEVGHRHISHLWALYPGTQITPDQAAIYKAARATLERRLAMGGGQTGWSRAWIINFWDHLHDGEKAYESMQVLLAKTTFPNLMDICPPGIFQIDGNLGAANGMLEALVQSRWNPSYIDIDLIPALPRAWKDGSIEGLRVRGGGKVAMAWHRNADTEVSLHATIDQTFRVQSQGRLLSVAGSANPPSKIVSVEMKAGQDVNLRVVPSR